ncbi:MAG: pyridoxamine 5'-phosphate oxidase family protein [Nitrococcus sp.]|nr:pyridoxamine 5'-phosphate oxidase family protein [Nitrococcus sp.]
MSETAHHYTQPELTTGTLPGGVGAYLDGTDLLAKTQALRLSTVHESGWPHAALLSAGDVLAVSPQRIRFVVFPESTTTANLVRDGRLTLTLSLDGGMCELLMRARRLDHTSPDVPLAFFQADVELAKLHRAAYAAITSGITFALHDPSTVLRRWERQIAAMREAG